VTSIRAIALSVARLGTYAAFTLALMPVQWLLVRIRSPWVVLLPKRYHQTSSRILGFRVEVRGSMSTQHPTLFACNHSSYTDISILGGVIPGCFVAKAEVAGWPLFGWLAKLQRTVFVDRRVRTTATQRDAMAERLAAGENLILFPEGTSNDGNRVLPFKSSLFSVAEYRSEDGRALAVQPVSIAYTKLDGMPLGRAIRPMIAWYGDMEMFSHMWTLVGLGVVTVVVEFHPVVTLRDLGSRKALAEHCHRVVSNGVAAALAGRPMPDRPAAPVAETVAATA
jgi:1-acyl-sn-glycerol-3-phosphate acyltransferase